MRFELKLQWVRWSSTLWRSVEDIVKDVPEAGGNIQHPLFWCAVNFREFPGRPGLPGQANRSCFLQFLTGLFQMDPSMRWTAKQARPWCLAKIVWTMDINRPKLQWWTHGTLLKWTCSCQEWVLDRGSFLDGATLDLHRWCLHHHICRVWRSFEELEQLRFSCRHCRHTAKYWKSDVAVHWWFVSGNRRLLVLWNLQFHSSFFCSSVTGFQGGALYEFNRCSSILDISDLAAAENKTQAAQE